MKTKKVIIICSAVGLCIILCSIPLFKKNKNQEINQSTNLNFTADTISDKEGENNTIKISIDTSQFIYDESSSWYRAKHKIESISGSVNGDLDSITSFSYNIKDEKGILIKEGNVEGIEKWTISDIGFVLGKNTLTLIADSTYGKSTKTINISNESYENINNLSIDNTDSDGDGLIDYWENYFALNKEVSDTDFDGISDFDEITILGTDSSKNDTTGNGINDGDEDFDNDKLTNKEELKYGTDPYNADTDSDSLSDYDEVYIYKTNPLLADTDLDGAKDGWEIANNYDPLVKNEYFTLNVASSDNKAKLYSNTIQGKDVENFSIEQSKEIYLECLIGAKSKVYELGCYPSSQISIEYTKSSEEENPLIYEYDIESKKINALSTTVDDIYLTAKTTENMKALYIVIDKTLYDLSLSAPEDEVDDGTDSNNDGISDKDTKKMCDGLLLTSEGKRVFGDANYDEIQKNSDYDKDGLKNGEEITIIKNDDNIRYVELKSSPALYDTDNDGINDLEDTAPLTRGLKDGIIGAVQIYSRHKPDENFFLGHSFLVFTSYVNDEKIVIKDIDRSYLYDKNKNTYVIKDGDYDSHTLNRGEYVSIGNYRSQGLDIVYDSIIGDYEAFWVDSGLSEYLNKDDLSLSDLLKFGSSDNASNVINGAFSSMSDPSIRFNQEIHHTYAYEGFTQYPNAVLTKEVTKEQLDKMAKYAENHNYYNVFANNCASIATGAWNEAFDEKLYAKEESGMYSLFDAPMILKKHILEKENSLEDVKTFGIPIKK